MPRELEVIYYLIDPLPYTYSRRSVRNWAPKLPGTDQTRVVLNFEMRIFRTIKTLAELLNGWRSVQCSALATIPALGRVRKVI